MEEPRHGQSAQIPRPDFHLLSDVRGSEELTGSLDLLGHFGLRPGLERLQTRPVVLQLSESGYLGRSPGEVALRRGPGMELCQLLAEPPTVDASELCPLDLATLCAAFTLREAGPLAIPQEGVPTEGGRKEKKHKSKEKSKHKHKDKHKGGSLVLDAQAKEMSVAGAGLPVAPMGEGAPADKKRKFVDGDALASSHKRSREEGGLPVASSYIRPVHGFAA
eukprot:jgi/Mesvir1/24098/Mv10820-RA.1